MLRGGLAERQAQWARFHAWEKKRNRQVTGVDGEVIVRAVGEIVEFYLEAAGNAASARRSVAVKAEGVRRLQRALRSVAPR